MDGLRVNSGLVIPAAELRESFSRSAGPGGQNVNKVATKVELRWSPTGSDALAPWQRQRILERLASRLVGDGDLVVTCDEFRTQGRNRDGARDKLAAMLAAALVRPKPRKKTRPTRSSVRKRVEKKRQRSELKKRRGRPRFDD
jgi:ribosome-associated protein